MTEKRFSVKKRGSGLFYRDEDYEIDNTIQFIIETVEMKLNQLSDENEDLKKENERLKDELIKDKEIERLTKEIEKLKIERPFSLPKNYKEKVKIVLSEHQCKGTQPFFYSESYMFTITEFGTVFSYKCPKCGNVLFIECDKR